MALDADKLKNLLRVKFDPEYANFDGYPETTEESRQFWSDCVQDWIEDLECVSPPTVDPKPAPIVGGAGAAYGSALIMAPGAGTFHTEMASAFAAMVGAISIPPGGDYTGSGSNAITAITPLNPATAQPVYQAAILALMIRNSGEVFCFQVASALTTAMQTAGATTCVYTIPNPPGSASGPLIFG